MSISLNSIVDCSIQCIAPQVCLLVYKAHEYHSYLRIINHSEIGVMFTNLAFTNWGTILQVPSQEIVGSILGAAVPVLCHYMSLYVAIVRGLVMSQLIVLTLPTAAPGRVNSPCHRLYYWENVQFAQKNTRWCPVKFFFLLLSFTLRQSNMACWKIYHLLWCFSQLSNSV